MTELKSLEIMENALVVKDRGNEYPILWRAYNKRESEPCPFCGLTHKHGSGEGHRIAHCSKNIKAVSIHGTEYLRKNGYVILEF